MNQFTTQIHLWYRVNKRELPWRNTLEPYKIWISEIILQQTRVEQGKTYYLNFIERFPTLKHLAEATEEEVLKIWQGLGYYSRARNLHQTARFIQKELHGKFPERYEDIISLKGIGPYTGAAIASIAFGLPYPAIDGNIYRVLSRYYGISTPVDSTKGKKEFHELASGLLPPKNSGFHNQALMEFGALQCTPKSPDCKNCPLADSCFAFSEKKIEELPVKGKRTKQRNRYFYYFYIDNGKFTWLEKRTKNDIWKNLYQFPLIESDKELTDSEIAGLKKIPFLNGHPATVKKISKPVKHILSHQVIFATLIHIEITAVNSLPDNLIKVEKNSISNFPVPRLIEILLKNPGQF
jgi:A/G-specific adenine glycosylase